MSKDSKKIATLWDNKNADDQDHDHGEQDGRDAQAFYAGGSEHSGQQILGPNRDPNGLIQNLFRQARNAAPQLSDPSDSSSRSVTSGSGSSLPIIFWRNGFTVGEEGELREYASEENRRFIECLRRGETPPELASRVRGGMIDVKLEDKAHLDHKPEKKLQAFTGEGHRLGAPSPAILDEQQTSSEKPTSTSDKVESISSLQVDESQPHTAIRVMLVDNSRLVIRANLTHSVGDLVSYIRSTRPQYSDTNFVLATTFPARELSNLEQTISEAKLVNASIVQKLKR